MYNAEAYIEATLESVMAQVYPSFRVIVLDDHSEDDSAAVVERFKERHPELDLSLIRNASRLGTAGNGNRCFEVAKTEFVARLDGDDLTPKYRLAEQVAFLDANPEIAQVGGYVHQFGDGDELMKYPLTDAEIKAQLPIFNAISQGTSMFRRAAVVNTGLQYDTDGPAIGEDWLYFYKLSRTLQQANLPKVMDRYRIHGQNISAARDAHYYENIDQVLLYMLQDLGLDPSIDELTYHYFLRRQYRVPVDKKAIVGFRDWTEKLRSAYTKNGLLEEVLDRYIAEGLEQLYFHLDPKDREAIDALQQHSPMQDVHRKYLRRKRLKRWFK
jgi:glycosyltransferase involved in cell wall biosynthesis